MACSSAYTCIALQKRPVAPVRADSPPSPPASSPDHAILASPRQRAQAAPSAPEKRGQRRIKGVRNRRTKTKKWVFLARGTQKSKPMRFARLAGDLTAPSSQRRASERIDAVDKGQQQSVVVVIEEQGDARQGSPGPAHRSPREQAAAADTIPLLISSENSSSSMAI